MFDKYLKYISEKRVLSSGYKLIFVSMINNIINKIIDEIIIPITNGEFEKEKINKKEYFALVLNLIVSTYILFIIIDFIENLYS